MKLIVKKVTKANTIIKGKEDYSPSHYPPPANVSLDVTYPTRAQKNGQIWDPWISVNISRIDAIFLDAETQNALTYHTRNGT
uniref:Uncharacterized protein n=1 Tax=Romanomermis culicivorax TaxID=13658 RepID=A0A915JAT7_ROMCU